MNTDQTTQQPRPPAVNEFVQLYLGDALIWFRVAFWDGNLCVMTTMHHFRWNADLGFML